MMSAATLLQAALVCEVECAQRKARPLMREWHALDEPCLAPKA